MNRLRRLVLIAVLLGCLVVINAEQPLAAQGNSCMELVQQAMSTWTMPAAPWIATRPATVSTGSIPSSPTYTSSEAAGTAQGQITPSATATRHPTPGATPDTE